MMRRFHSTMTIVFLSLAALACEPLLQAQSAVSGGTINGRVEDPSGAIITDADIVITNPETGYSQVNKSNGDGLFSFPALPVGVYSLSVAAHGFRGMQMTNLNASVGQTTAITVKMELGDTAQQVEVVANAEGLNTSESSISSVMGRTVIDNLPSLRRGYTDFVLLMPNVTVDGQFGNVSFAGVSGDSNNRYKNANASTSYTVDGANATSRYLGGQRGQTRIPYLFGAESVQEFQVAESPYSPVYGGGAAGYINTVTKSGTNSFHGAGFYFNRNTGAGGATDAISKAQGFPRALDVRQQFGAAVGGPVIKNKVFFFADYEQQRRKDPMSIINPAQSALNVTSFGLPAGTLLPAPDGYPVPSALSVATPTSPIYLQQVSDALYQIQSNIGFRQRRQNDLLFFEKADILATNKDQVSLHYNYNKFDSPGGASTANPLSASGISAAASNYVRDHSSLIHWTHALSPVLLLDTHVSYTRDDQISQPSGLAPAGFQPAVKLTVPSAFAVGNTAYSILREYQWAVSEQVSWIKGRHAFDIGGSFNRDSNVSLNYTGYNGSYTFASPTAFALGLFNLYSQSSGNPLIRVKFPTYAFYFGDTYKVNTKLTLNLGIRYDWTLYPQPPENPAIPLTGQYPNNYDRWAPRLGFAYNPTSRTVIRGGIGMFRSFLTSANYINATTSNGLASLRSSVSIRNNAALAPNAQDIVFPNILPTSSALFAASPNVNVVDPGLKEPTMTQASLQIQQQIGSKFTITVGSVWAHSMHLISSSYFDLNLKQPTGTTQYVVCPAGTVTVPCAGSPAATLLNLDSGLLQEGARFPGVGQVNELISPGNSTYLSGFTQMQRSISHGFAGTMSYTFAKNISGNGEDFNNQFSFANTKSLDVLDQRHRVVVGVVYQSQYSGSGIGKALLSNWMVSTSTQYGSGRPYAGILQSACVGASVSTCTAGSTLNDSAFNYGHGILGAGPSPNVGLNSFEGPWSGAVDINIERGFKISEYGKLMFRVTGFNVLNHPNYYVQSGSGINQQEYKPVGPNCGNKAQDQTCYLIPNNSPGGFGTFATAQQNTGPRNFQFSAIYRF